MIIKSLIAALIIFLFQRFILKGGLPEWQMLNSSKAKLYLSVFTALILFVIYILPVSYYFPHNNGVLGDNYLHMYWALDQPGFIKPHHPLFPLIPEKFVRLMMDIHVLSVKDSMFLEKAFYWSVFPVSLATAIALFLFIKSLRNKGVSNLLWLAIFFLVATSYGLWIWGIQSNAIGLSLAMELLVATVFVYWYKDRKRVWLVILALLIGTSIFLYNGLIYLALGSYVSIVWVLFSNKEDSLKNKLIELIIHSGILVLMAAAYYLLEAKVNHTYNIHKLFSKLSEVEYLGGFGVSNILSSIESNFWSGINWIVGFFYTTKYNYWEPVQAQVELPIGSNWVKAFQMGALFIIVITIISNYIKKKQRPSNDLLIYGLVNSVIFFIGFTIRMAGTHYYVLALVPNLILLVSFIVGKEEGRNKNPYLLPIFIILLGQIYFNAFTKLSVLEGNEINDHPYYYDSNSIFKITNGSNAVYFKSMDLDYYPNSTLVLYYKDKFKNTKWITKWNDINELEDSVSEKFQVGSKVFLSQEVIDIIDLNKFETSKINDDLYVLIDVKNP